jgi:hypothetical protein
MSTTLLQLRDDVREIVDDVNDILISDAALTRMLNVSGRSWHNKIADGIPDLFQVVDSITPTGAGAYALPTDYYKTIDVYMKDSDNSVLEKQLLKLTVRESVERYDLDTTTSEPDAYSISGADLALLPTVITGGRVCDHYYVQAWVDLSADGDTVMGLAAGAHDILDHWTQWIVYDTAIKVTHKERMPTGELERMKAEITTEINSAIQERSVNHPSKVQRVRHLDTRQFDPWHYHRDFWGSR